MPPVATVRQTPSGIKMDDGHSTKVTFARVPDIEFWEKTVKPPGVDGLDAIDTSTMHNVTWRTFSPRKLKTLTEFKLEAQYDPVLYVNILSLVNVEDTVTVRFPDGSTLAFYGYLKNFEPGDLAEGECPMCTITIQPTNADPVTGAESGPVLVEVSGT